MRRFNYLLFLLMCVALGDFDSFLLGMQNVRHSVQKFTVNLSFLPTSQSVYLIER